MIKKILNTVFLGCLVFKALYSQSISETHQKYIGEIIEAIIANTDEQPDLNSVFDDLYYYLENPLNLNLATREDLERLQLLTDFQISSFIDYRKTYGKLASIHELNYVFGFTEEITSLILPFVSVSDTEEKSMKFTVNDFKYARHEILTRCQRIIEPQKGYHDADSANPMNSYPGSPWKIYNRYTLNVSNRLMFGIIAEKDPGEILGMQQSPLGFDFVSGYIQYRSDSWLRNIVVGDFHMETGQGLVIWNKYASGKSSYMQNIQRISQHLKGNRSVDENGFLRGAGITLGISNLQLNLYASSKKVDANIELDEDVEKFTSLVTTGYHRTTNEIDKRKVLAEELWGVSLNYKTNRISIGFNTLDTRFGKEFLSSDELYKMPSEFKNNVFSASGHYRFIISKYQLFGEVAKSNNSWAQLHGLLIYLSSNFSLTALYRNYQPGYNAPYSNAIAENSTNKNEEGFFSGFEWQFNSQWYLKAFADVFLFPWLKYQTNRPSVGYEYYAETGYQFADDFDFYLRYTFQNKERNTGTDEILESPSAQRCQSFRVNMSYSIDKNLRFKNRFEWKVIDNSIQPRENGYLLYQDMDYEVPKMSLKFSFRYALFNTDSYDSRIYAYERDVRYALSTPAYYGIGSRLYLLVNYNFKKWLQLYLRYSTTNYNDRELIGNGLDEIEGNRKSEIKLQCIVKI